MKPFIAGVIVAGTLTLGLPTETRAEGAAADEGWPQWRGPLGTGVSATAEPPLTWSAGDDTNIRWKTELPGRGHSTPVVWRDHVFVTSAIPYGPALKPRMSQAPGAHDNLPATHRHKFVVIALDRRDGRIRWQRTVREALPHDGGGHNTGSLASHSPVTDGERVIACFGSNGLYCLDFDGSVLWEADLGQMHSLHGHGEGSSPALSGRTLVVNCDHEGGSFVVAFDTQTGNELWRAARDEVTSWSSPIIIEHGGRLQAVVNGTRRMRGYALDSGEVLWECGGLSSNVVASPVYADGMVFAGSSYEKRALLAVRLDGSHGDVTDTRQIAWTRSRGSPYVPSPLLYDGSLYYLGHYQAVLSRVNAKSGLDDPGAMRLPGLGDIYASPVAAAGRIYVTDREGTTLVLAHTNKLKVLAENRLEERVNASAALAGRELFLRGETSLYCVGE